MEMQKSLGEMSATLNGVKSSVDGLKGKVDELVFWKHKILGGAAVLGFVFALIGFGITKLSGFVSLQAPTATAPTAATQPPATPQQPAAPAKPASGP